MLADLTESLAAYDDLMADLRASQAEIQRAEHRIGLLGTLLMVEGATVKFQPDVQGGIAERLTARIKVISAACFRRLKGRPVDYLCRTDL